MCEAMHMISMEIKLDVVNSQDRSFSVGRRQAHPINIHPPVFGVSFANRSNAVREGVKK